MASTFVNWLRSPAGRQYFFSEFEDNILVVWFGGLLTGGEFLLQVRISGGR